MCNITLRAVILRACVHVRTSAFGNKCLQERSPTGTEWNKKSITYIQFDYRCILQLNMKNKYSIKISKVSVFQNFYGILLSDTLRCTRVGQILLALFGRHLNHFVFTHREYRAQKWCYCCRYCFVHLLENLFPFHNLYWKRLKVFLNVKQSVELDASLNWSVEVR